MGDDGLSVLGPRAFNHLRSPFLKCHAGQEPWALLLDSRDPLALPTLRKECRVEKGQEWDQALSLAGPSWLGWGGSGGTLTFVLKPKPADTGC